MKKLLNFIVVITTLLMLSACANNPPMQLPSNDTNAIETIVAGTLSAIPSAIPTSVPTIISTPELTATFTPEPATLRVVYSRAGEIYIWNEGGNLVKLSNTGIDIQPRISSDGKLVVFARNNELYAVNPDGSNLRVIVSKEYLNLYRPEGYKWIWAEHYDWMLNTHILYFTTITQKENDGFPSYQFDLHRIDVDTGDASIVLPAGQGGVPYFSPNKQTMAVIKPDSISLANVDGSEWRTALPFERVFTYSEWFFIPIVTPLPDASGFRVIIPAHDPLGNPGELSELWELPLKGQPVLLHTFLQNGFSLRALSPSGNSMAYSKKDASGNSSLCSYQHNVAQETCIPKVGEQVYADAWSLNDSKYNYQTIDKVLTGSDYVYETTRYIMSATESNGLAVKIDGYVWFEWVNPEQYLYIDEEWNLRLATLGDSSFLIHNGVKAPASKDGILPFDFSTR